MPEPGISIIVPALNEAEGIARMLETLQPLRREGHEVIVVDGGSQDATPEIAERYADRVLRSAPGRAIQMNLGARQARGKILWFLHADTLIAAETAGNVVAALHHDAAGNWGRCDVRIDGGHWLLDVVAFLMNWRSRLTGIATGDQAIFVSRSEFAAIEGYPNQPLMEDIELSKRLKRRSAPVCLKARVTTSGRRWERNGVIKTIMTMWWLRLAYFLGARPERLAVQYDKGAS